jgi:exonuclease SbcC
MRILNLKLKNFKSVKEREFDFSKNKINIIVGKNGSGKSSVVDAITYLLTDHLYESLSEYVNWDEGIETSELQIKFTHLGITYDYKVILKAKGSTERLLKVSNTSEEYKNSDAVKKIKELYNPKLVLYSSISTQHESTSLLFENPSERLKKLKQILGLERIEEISDQLKADIETEKLRCLSLDSEISVLKQRKFSYMKVPDLEDMSTLQNKYELLSKEYKIYEDSEKKYKQFLQLMEDYESNLDNRKLLLSEIEDLEKKLSQVSLLSLQIIDTEEESKNTLVLKKLEKQETEFDLLNKAYLQYTKDSETYKLKIKDLELKISQIQVKRLGKCDITDKTIQNLQDDLSSLNSVRLSLENSLELCRDGKCSKCGSIYNEDPDHIETQLLRNKELINYKTSELKSSMEALSKFREEKAQNDLNLSSKKTLEENKSDFEKFLSDLKIVERPTEDFRVELKECRLKDSQFLEKRRNNLEIEEKNKQAEKTKLSIEATIDSKKKQISQYDLLTKPAQVEKPIFEKIEEFTELDKAITVYEEKKKQREQSIIFNSTIEKEEKENQSLIDLKVNEYNESSSKQRVLSEARKILDKDFSSYVIDVGSSFIKNKMNEFFTKSYGRYQVDFKKDNKSVHFFYTPDSKVYKSVGVASGFERQALSLSFRVSLNSIQNLGFYLLDEIESSAEDENSLSLFENLLNEEFEQIICVTHKEPTKEYLINQKEAEVFEMVS